VWGNVMMLYRLDKDFIWKLMHTTKSDDDSHPLYDSPRPYADKSDPFIFRQAIRYALQKESDAIKFNTQSFNQNRYTAVAQLPDYVSLKDKARAIKEKSIEHLPELLPMLERAITARGGHFYIAKTAVDACEYIASVCTKHQAKLITKSKSMTTEEIRLNPFLERSDIEIVETDLAEFIIQLADEQPSHLTAPAIHWSRENITKLFKQKFETSLSLDTGEELTKFARGILREKFLRADVGISGANVIAADTGTLLIVESEGNIRMVTQAPPVHIAVAGIEKVVPTFNDLIPFLELLAPSATGQPLSSYSNVLTPPLDLPVFHFTKRTTDKREFYLVLVDNGRNKMRDDPALREALYCIRCSACQNSCANFQVLGGHAFGGETYSGGIGSVWEAGIGTLEKARFAELCTGCARCVPNCPVQIDIPWLNTVIRNRLYKRERRKLLSAPHKFFLKNSRYILRIILQKQLFSHFKLIASVLSRLSQRFIIPFFESRTGRQLLERAVFIRGRHFLPVSPRWYIKEQSNEVKKLLQSQPQFSSQDKVLLISDIYTTYAQPDYIVNAVEVLTMLGINVIVSKIINDGRDSLSQGMIELSRKRAKKTADYLKRFLDEGRDIVVIEPSVFAMFRRDYMRLLNDDELFNRIKNNSYDSIEYVAHFLEKHNKKATDYFSLEGKSKYQRIFFHNHCQQRSVQADQKTIELLTAIGFDIQMSSVECCGMGGSFGYKKGFYDVSMKVGEELFDQIENAETPDNQREVVSSGISCNSQIHCGFMRGVAHPIELLDWVMIEK